MALQQISTGGASSPVAPLDATSSAGQNQGFNLQQYLEETQDVTAPLFPSGARTPQIAPTPSLSSTGSVSLPGPLSASVSPISTPSVSATPIQIDPFSYPSSDANVFIGGGTPAGEAALASGAPAYAGNPYPWDPFSFAGSGSAEGSALPSEASSPGYESNGQSWLNLINTIGSQNLPWGGTNQGETELKGGGSVGPWLSQNIVTPYSSGNQQQALDNATYFISSQTGKSPSDPETQQLGAAFLEYTLQNANRYGANTANFEQRAAENDNSGIFGDVAEGLGAIVSIVQPELAPFIAAGLSAYDASQGNYLGAALSVLGGVGGELSDLASFSPGAFGDIGNNPELLNTLGVTDTAANIGPSLAGDAATLSDLGTAGQIAGAAGAAGNAGQAIAQGNYIGALGPGVELGNAATSFLPNTPTGTTGTNAPESGGVLSGLANQLNLTPQQLVDYLGGGIGVGESAVPLIQRLTASSPTLSPSVQAEAPLAAPAAAQTQPATRTPQQVLEALGLTA